MTRQPDTMTIQELRKAQRARHKFGAEPTSLDGIRFPSKLEGRLYLRLTDLQTRQKIVGFIRQPQFDLGGGTKYTADFLVFHVDGSCEFLDAKGVETKAFVRAKKQVEGRYPWIGEIRVVKNAKGFMPDA